MVYSILKPEIEYNESKKLNVEDEGFSTFLYEVEIFETRVIVGVGKIKYTYTGKNIFYYLIYLMQNDAIRSQIGVFELSKNDVARYTNDENDMDVEKFLKDGNSMLLYSFVTKEFLGDGSTRDNRSKIEEPKKEEKQEDSKGEEKDNDDDVTDLHFEPSDSSTKTPIIIAGSIFEEIANADIPDLLKEESKSDAEKLKNKSANLNWIQKFMKNDNYRLQSIAKDDDSFFATILYAFKQIGKKTTIERLRQVVSEAVNVDLLKQYSSIYHSFNNEISDNEHKIEIIKKNVHQTKERYKSTNDIATNKKLLEQIGVFKEDAKLFQKRIRMAQQRQEPFKFMKDVHTLEQLRAKPIIVDNFAISKLEEELNVKFIALSKKRFDAGDEDGVMQCSLGEGNITKPDYYILLSLDANHHFDLVSYKDKKILKFSEIPYFIKTLVVNKCIERNAGSFHHITDFRDFQTKLGIDPLASDSAAVVISELYDDTTHFMFYVKSADEDPGEGSGERIKYENRGKFKDLLLIENWRQQLDDEFVSPFMLDNKQWQTVEHYYQASKFKKGFPDFYSSFSLDSGSETAMDVKKAKAAGGKTGRFEKELIRPNHIKLDADFYGGRDIIERRVAVKAKFQQNSDLKTTLVKTKDAKLLHFVRGSPSEIDTILMETRKHISPAYNIQTNAI